MIFAEIIDNRSIPQKQALMGLFLTTCCQKLKVSVFSAAAGLKSGQFDRTKNLTA